jgi:hypothetical protein
VGNKEAEMAKNNESGGDASGNTGSTEAAAAAPATAADRRRIILPTGEARADYIRRRWTEKADRSTITKELNSAELNPAFAGGDEKAKVPYQIVFQATKGHAGGPDPKVEAPATAQPVAEGASS